MHVGVDGSNLRQGGGITHLVQLLDAADPAASGIDRVTVWGARRLLDELPDRRWLTARYEPALDGKAVSRVVWQQRRLAALARASVDLLFSPGATYLGSFHPFVTMFRNMLPWDAAERGRYAFSSMRVKLEVLRRVQAATFRRADGVIFLTEYARSYVLQRMALAGRQAVIPHGLGAPFFIPRGPQRPWSEFSPARPFRWLYVSAIYHYKHPWHVAEAVAQLRAEGMPASLELVGPAHASTLARLHGTLARIDPAGAFITVAGPRSHADLPALYDRADGFVFASTCENLPNALLEAMAAALPIVCSDRPPMPDILHDGGLYADPSDPASLAGAMRRVMADAALRARLAEQARARARAFTWARCARHTFDFLAETCRASGAERCAARYEPS